LVFFNGFAGLPGLKGFAGFAGFAVVGVFEELSGPPGGFTGFRKISTTIGVPPGGGEVSPG